MTRLKLAILISGRGSNMEAILEAARDPAYPAQPVMERCRCSKDRVESVLTSLSDEEIRDMTVDGLVFVVCEFCKSRWEYDEAGMEKLRAGTDN